MHPALGFLILVATVIGMETVAYAVHRWIMHGPGWFLHRSHHEPAGKLEANDLYGLIFAIPSVLLIYGGMNRGWPDWTTWVGWGVAVYWPHLFRFSRRHRSQAAAAPVGAPLGLSEAHRPGASPAPCGRQPDRVRSASAFCGRHARND
jgi:hypothetical protein